jgi:hypothetical protein
MLTNARIASHLSIALLAVACSAAGTSTPDPDSAATPLGADGDGTAKRRPGHILPVKSVDDGKVKTTSFAKLTYRGGPVIPNVKIVTVFWGASVPDQAKINDFFTAVTDSPYFDWLAEYNTPTQKIGRGSLVASFVDTPSSSSNVSDGQVSAEIKKLIGAGKIPKNDGNTLYMVYFPPGVTISMGGDSSCSSFCAYHNSDTYGGQSLYYGVMPHLGGACAGGCGGGTEFQNLCSASSHEMIEAVTDPAVGNGNLAWYDDNQGEIGDICNQEEGTVNGFNVQAEWSNKKGSCIVTDPNAPNNGGAGGSGAGGSGTGAGGSGVAGSGTGAGGSGTAGSGAGGSGVGGSGVGGSGTAGSGPGAGGCDNGGGDTCAHDVCAQGEALDASCSSCASSLCQADPFCCNQGWDDVCVSEVVSYCGQACN